MISKQAWQRIVSTVVSFSRILTRHHQVLGNLVRRDITIRYKGSLLGVVWAFLNPLGTMVVFLIIFSYVGKFQTSEPYALFLLTAIIPWGFFSNSVMKSVTIMIDHATVIKKVYFPREILPLAAVLAEMLHLMLGMLLLTGLVALFYPHSLFHLWTLPLLVLVQFFFTLGVCFFLCVTQVFMKDTVQLVTIVMTFWYFLTPIFYPLSIIPVSYHQVYLLNPVASMATLYRFAFLGREEYICYAWCISLIAAVVVFLSGYAYFKKHENSFVKLL